MKRTYLLVLFGVMVWISPVQAAAILVDGGSHEIQSQANQVVDLYVTGGVEIAGFDLSLKVGNGQAGPKITAVDLESGIFLGNHFDQFDGGSTDWIAVYYISTQAGSVIAEGRLVRLTLDATAVPQGTYDLVMTEIEYSKYGTINSTFVGEQSVLPATFLPGTITVVPEPASIALVGGVALLLRRRVAMR